VLQLPPKTDELVAVEFTDEEREVRGGGSLLSFKETLTEIPIGF
jgi:hypothetical protein